MEPTETALIVPVREAEAAVGPFRAVLDRAAGRGVPAHVTVLYPFLPPAQIDDQVLATVADLVRVVPRFEVTFTHVEWFGDTAIWLAPRPADPFRSLTAAVWRRFPQTPPYAGAHPGVVPHLTIGHDAPTHVLDQAAQAVSAALPLHAIVDTVQLICGSTEPDSWHVLTEFPLGDSSG